MRVQLRVPPLLLCVTFNIVAYTYAKHEIYSRSSFNVEREQLTRYQTRNIRGITKILQGLQESDDGMFQDYIYTRE